MSRAAVISLLVFLGIFAAGISWYAWHQTRMQPLAQLSVRSSAFAAGTIIPSRFTCDGEDVRPPLEVSGIPNDAKTLAIIVDDPDAPRGTWVHWVVWNIPASQLVILDEGTLPVGSVEGATSFGDTGYGGPCPPDGQHRYYFKVYAVDTALELPDSATKSDLEAALEGHVMGEGELIGLYTRS